MNWDAIGAIEELLGAVGVIASLVYLATQIRQSRDQMSQNTRAMRAETCQLHRTDKEQSMLAALTVPRLSKTVASGMANFEQLNQDDAFQFNFWLHGVMIGFGRA